MRKTREEKAITLIALIITIVVLLILAVVAINAVTGDGIIQHATNARSEYEKAQDTEEDMLSYYEGVLQSGQVVPTVEQLQENYKFEYYNSLSDAIKKVNGETVTTVSDENAVAGIYEDDGNTYVVLMKDTEESATINIIKNLTINLGGKTLSLIADAAYLNFEESCTDCTIDGRIGGSTIQKNIQDGVATGIIVSKSNTLKIKSGKYSMEGKYTGGLYAIRIENTTSLFELNNANIALKNTASSSTSTRGIRLATKQKSLISNSNFDVNTVSGTSIGIATSSPNTGTIEINNSNVKVSSDNSYSIGVLNGQNTEMMIRTTDIYADASGNNISSNRYSYGIRNQGGIIKFYSGSAKGTLFGYVGDDDTFNYIYGGTFSGLGSVGVGINNVSAKVYIENATILSGNYDGKYYENFASEDFIADKAFWIGNGPLNADEVGEPIYMDNCKIDTNIYFVGGSYELNMSNCEIIGTIEASNTAGTQVVNLGERMKEFEADKITFNKTGISYKGMDRTLMQEN